MSDAAAVGATEFERCAHPPQFLDTCVVSPHVCLFGTEFNGLKIDPRNIFERNRTKPGTRKNGILINDGGVFVFATAERVLNLAFILCF